MFNFPDSGSKSIEHPLCISDILLARLAGPTRTGLAICWLAAVAEVWHGVNGLKLDWLWRSLGPDANFVAFRRIVDHEDHSGVVDEQQERILAHGVERGWDRQTHLTPPGAERG